VPLLKIKSDVAEAEAQSALVLVFVGSLVSFLVLMDFNCAVGAQDPRWNMAQSQMADTNPKHPHRDHPRDQPGR